MRSLFMTKRTLVYAAALLTTLTVASASQAAYAIKIDDGVNIPTVIFDNGLGDLSATPNLIVATYTHPNGMEFVINSSLTVSPTQITLTLQVNAIGFGNILNFTVEALAAVSGFAIGPATLSNFVSHPGSTLTLDGTTTYDDPPSVSTPTVTLPSGTNSGLSSAGVNVTDGVFVLSGKLVLNGTAGTVNESLTSRITAVPVPPALALLASGAPVALLGLRRRRK
jgi:hypothetical protein